MGATGEVDFSSTTGVCTENRLHWDLSPEQIRKMSDELIANTKKVFDAVGSLDLDRVTLSNTLKALADMETEYTVQETILYFLRSVSPSKEVRAASIEASEKLPKFDVDMSRREDVYKRIHALRLKLDEESLTAEDKRYMERWLGELALDISGSYPLKNKKRNGVHRRSKKKRDKIKGTSLSFSRDELGGVPKDVLSSLEADGEKLKVTLEDCDDFMEKCFVPETRKRLAKAINLRDKESSAVMALLTSCSRTSPSLEFQTYADFVLKSSMAKSAQNVSNFLDELAHKLKPLADKERTNLLKLKQDECQKRGLPFNGELYMEDLEYYKAQVLNQYGVDHNQLKEYFPLEVVTQGLLDICQDLLGLSFSLVHGAPVWHPDVTLYCVTDRSSGQTIGQFYLDLFTREGKEMDADCLGYCELLQPSCLLSDGRRQIAVTAIVTKFIKPTAVTPCLLKHDDVEMFFHEFGHAMHDLCAQVDYAVFNAAYNAYVELDFMEAPSKMLENWVWEKEPLQRISKHYKTGAPIPDDLLDKLVESRLADISMDCLEKIVKAKLDQFLHTQFLGTRSLANKCWRLSKDILGVPAFQGPIISYIGDEVADGYGAELYRHLWVEVLSMDMFYSRFKQEGIMNPMVGLDYRNCILKPGASKDAKEMLKNFLGREPNKEAFLLSKGITVKKQKRKMKKKSKLVSNVIPATDQPERTTST